MTQNWLHLRQAFPRKRPPQHSNSQLETWPRPSSFSNRRRTQRERWRDNSRNLLPHIQWKSRPPTKKEGRAVWRGKVGPAWRKDGAGRVSRRLRRKRGFGGNWPKDHGP